MLPKIYLRNLLFKLNLPIKNEQKLTFRISFIFILHITLRQGVEIL
ncbi:hypothetical protein NTG1052_300015 [Candidatus Nitrotoga sp. 1052]|nr:hypothetical protein NTG1052_300015 [Candidatus Nitrotoga sp. 1052]